MICIVLYRPVDASGRPLPNRWLTAECGGIVNGHWVPVDQWLDSQVQVIDPARERTDADGLATLRLEANTGGTCYRVTVAGSDDRYIVVPDIPGPVDMKTLLTVNPPDVDVPALPAATFELVDNGDGTWTLTSIGAASLTPDGHGLVSILVGA